MAAVQAADPPALQIQKKIEIKNESKIAFPTSWQHDTCANVVSVDTKTLPICSIGSQLTTTCISHRENSYVLILKLSVLKKYS